MRLVYHWLREYVPVSAGVEAFAHEIALRGFEVAGIEQGNEPVVDFEITANRPDCLSHIGLAREASAIWGLPLHDPLSAVRDPLPEAPGSAVRGPRSGAEEAEGAELEVELEDAELCPRYCAQVFDVKVGPSPSWLQERLHAAGVRPINNVVDVTNYVMLELGQPMHAFDLDRLAGRRLVIRRARPGERVRTLDNVERDLEPDMLVIADAERASAIGGVMGGLDSEIGSQTTKIALESAYFQPASIRRTSKRLGLRTEASSRFERGGDINAPPGGIVRAAALFARIGAAAPAGGLIDRYPSPRRPIELALRADRIARLLGQAVPADAVRRILEPLGFTVSEARTDSGAGWMVTVPTFRVDVSREVDLIEEVARHYGFDRLPTTFPPLVAPGRAPDARIGRDRLIRQVLTAAGFSESMTFSFIERPAALPFCEPGQEPAAIANPLSEKFAVLRPSMLPGLVDSCAHNRRRGRRDVRLFETGSRVTSAGEGRAVALAWGGSATVPHWSVAPRTVDFFDVKGVVEGICAACGIASPEFTPATTPYLVAGRGADVRARGVVLGVLGQLQPAICEARGLPAAEHVYVAELDVDRLAACGAGDTLRAETLPRFPSIVRDVSILVDEVLPAATVRGTIRAAGPATLISIVEFDRYQGKGVPEGRVSLSLRLTFQASDRTLTDEEAQSATERIVDALRAAHRAERR